MYFLLILLAIPTNITFWKCFVSCSFTFLVVVLATTVSSLVDEGSRQLLLSTVCAVARSIKLQHIQLTGAAVLFIFSGAGGRHSPTNQNSDTYVYLIYKRMAIVHSVFRVCVCVCVCVCVRVGGYLRLSSPLMCESHEL